MRPRPWLILAGALTVLLLVPLWGTFGFLSKEEPSHAAGGHGGGGHHGGGGNTQEAKEMFATETKIWMASHTRKDGCVDPGLPGEKASGAMSGEGMEDMEGMDSEDMDMSDEKAEGAGGHDEDDGHEDGDHGDMEGMDMEEDAKHAKEHPVVYLQAFSFGYLPQRLCLKEGVTYQFKVMATDVTHGAAIQMENGSKIMRLPAGSEVSEDVKFSRPGDYLVYCSSYCGLGHQFMKGQIFVERGDGKQPQRGSG